MFKITKDQINNIPEHYKTDYYISKFPLYLRETKEESYYNLLNYLNNFYKQALNLDTSLDEFVYNYTSNKDLQFIEEKALPNTNKQAQLKYWYDKYKKEDNNIIHSKYYYQNLINNIERIRFDNTREWRHFLSNFQLLKKVRINVNETSKKIILELHDTVDRLTQKIFQSIIHIPYIDEVVVKNWEINDRATKVYFDQEVYINGRLINKTAYDNDYYSVELDNILEIEEE